MPGVVLADSGRQMPWTDGIIGMASSYQTFLPHRLTTHILEARAIVGIHAGPLARNPAHSGITMASGALHLNGDLLASLLDREAEFVTALIARRRPRRAHDGAWGGLGAVLAVSGMAPAFAGPPVILLTQGHAGRHNHRRLRRGDDQAAARAATSRSRATIARRPFERCEERWSESPSRPSSACASIRAASATVSPA